MNFFLIKSNRNTYGNLRGFGMIEVIIASAIIGAVVVGVISVYHSLADISLENAPHIQATFLMEEGLEAVRVIRDTSWSQIASTTNNIPYHLQWRTASSTWVLSTSTQIVDIFTRTITFSQVQRDIDFNITQGSGTVDPLSRRVQVRVEWLTDSGTSSKQAETYIFRTFNN